MKLLLTTAHFSSFQVYELKFNLKMKHMTQMPFSLNIADSSKSHVFSNSIWKKYNWIYVNWSIFLHFNQTQSHLHSCRGWTGAHDLPLLWVGPSYPSPPPYQIVQGGLDGIHLAYHQDTSRIFMRGCSSLEKCQQACSGMVTALPCPWHHRLMPAQHSTDGGHSLSPFWIWYLMISGCELWGDNALRFKNVSMQQVLVLLQPTAIVNARAMAGWQHWALFLPSSATPLEKKVHLKGKSHEIFCTRFFSPNNSSWSH